jgi:hypothetical protein
MNKKTGYLAVFLVILLSALTLAGLNPASAQTPGQITVSNISAQMNFPLTLKFSSQIRSNVNITDIRLRYRVEQMSFADVISEAVVLFTPGTSVNASYTLDMRRVGGLPPGANLNYWWRVKDAGGAVLETEPVQYQIHDNRVSWHNLSEGKINLFWYQGNNSFAQSLMATAQQSLIKLAKDTGATPEKTIKIYIYANSRDLQGSMIYPNEWTGGVAFTQFNVIAIGISPSDLAWGQSAMTHELTHNVIAQVVFNPYSDLPVWLNEGLAMYAEGPLSSQFTVPLRRAIETDSLISVRSISSPFSADPDKANLSYAESATLVDYLIQQYGSEKMSELLQTFKQGSTYDGAFQKVYGFDMDGLNTQWQTWVKTLYGQ